MSEYQPPSEPVAVSPKYDCPHGDIFVSITPNQAVEAFQKHSCNSCNSNYEPWLCLHCAFIGCSRYVSGHASTHCTNQGHNVSLSFSDFSVWCYECDSYIWHEATREILQSLRLAKFPPKEAKEQDSYFICNCCYKECEDYDLCITCQDGGKASDDHDAKHKVSEHKLKS